MKFTPQPKAPAKRGHAIPVPADAKIRVVDLKRLNNHDVGNLIRKSKNCKIGYIVLDDKK